MRVMIVTKPTNFEQHGAVVKAQVASGDLISSDLDELAHSHDQHYQCLEKVKEALSHHKIHFDIKSRGDKWSTDSHFDFIVSVGGDGTLLSASHHILDNTPIIGIRSSDASIGYLCAGGIDATTTLIDKQIRNQLKYHDCARLQAHIKFAESGRDHHTVPSLNDFLFANQNPSATTRYNIKLGQSCETHKSSGVWIATATGSTAGIKAAGGVVMQRQDQRFQYKVRELYTSSDEEYFELTGGIFEPEAQLVIENRNESAVLALDGQRGVLLLNFGDTISFSRAPCVRIAARV